MRRAILLGAALLWGCNTSPYCIECNLGDGGLDDGAGDGAHGDGIIDLDANPHDACQVGGVEVCNGLDDDCNGQIDDSPTDVGGACGTDTGPCVAGTWECQAGERVCGGGAVNAMPEDCNDIDDDCDGTVDDGDPGGGILCGTDVGDCQKGVTACLGGSLECVGGIESMPESCDGRDNDCDGVIDNGDPEGGTPCGVGIGVCAPGTNHCVGGTIECQGAGIPSAEACNGFDDDCDGPVDEDFDLTTDPNNCGMCGHSCAGMFVNAVAQCVSSTCTLAYCLSGYHDLDGAVTPGCEYACDFAGGEICNGADDDCDGSTDEGLTPPAICNNVGPCAGTVATCTGVGGWVCNYPASVSTDAMGNIVPETTCDGFDDDCDGVADDAFPTKGAACGLGMGVCHTTGIMVCNGTMDGVVCNAPTPPAGTAETCNGLDDDCDGTPDEGAPDAFVQITGTFGTHYIYQYEASRPDATGASQGVMSHRPCSVTGRLPWTNITQPEAEAQCVSIGARLCSEAEWQRACQTTAGTPCKWSYSSACTTYATSTCNGNDYDFDTATAGDQDGLLATAALPMCYANWGAMKHIFDLSGNVKEWAAERSAGVNPLRGGSYNNTQVGISCNYNFLVADDVFQFNNVGFRCCRDTAP